MEKEITLGDYGRVLWSGRWVLLAAAVGSALVGLVTSFARQTEYTSSSIVYMGLVTTARTGVPVSTPFTTPATAQKALAADRFVQTAADSAGVEFNRVKDGVSFVVERVPGAVGGNQPTVATIRYTDRDRATAIRVTNAYAGGVFDIVKGSYQDVFDVQQQIVDRADARVAAIQKTLDRQRGQSPASATLLLSLQQELATQLLSADEAKLILAKTRQIEQPSIISEATSAASSARPGQRLRTIVFGTVLGLLLGAIVTFIWRGSPAGRAAE